MPKKKDSGRLLLFHKFPEKLRRLRPRQQQIRPPDSLLRVVERTREDFRGLCCAHVGARQEKIRGHSEPRPPLAGLQGFLHPSLPPIPFPPTASLPLLTIVPAPSPPP